MCFFSPSRLRVTIKMMAKEDEILGRFELLMGRETVDRIGQKRVILFGVGGVGS